MNNNLTIVIPAYNESQSLQRFFPEVLTHCEQKGYKVIIVNDGSSDDTLAVLKKFQETSPFDFTIRSHKVNRGYGGAIKSGIELCETEYVITIDADGQHYLEDVDKLLEQMILTDADLIVGSRKGLASASVYRSIGKTIIRSVAKTLMKLHVYDLNSGMKIYNTELVQGYVKHTPDSMSFSDIITLMFISNRNLVIEHPIRIKDRLEGKSTIGIRTAFDTFLEIVNIIILFNPARIFLPISIFFLVLGTFWGALFFFQGKGISIAGSTFILSGVIIFLLGLIAEQLSVIRKNQ